MSELKLSTPNESKQVTSETVKDLYNSGLAEIALTAVPEEAREAFRKQHPSPFDLKSAIAGERNSAGASPSPAAAISDFQKDLKEYCRTLSANGLEQKSLELEAAWKAFKRSAGSSALSKEQLGQKLSHIFTTIDQTMNDLRESKINLAYPISCSQESLLNDCLSFIKSYTRAA